MSGTPKDPDLEFSPLCQRVSEAGVTIQLHIYRILGENDGWSMEVVDPEGASTVWNELFQTDKDAFAEFQSTVAAEGIEAFLVSTERALH